MAGIKESFSKGITTINVKTSTFMEQNKYKTYINTLETEKAKLIKQVGESVYEQWRIGSINLASIEPMLQQIHEKEDEVAVQKQKIEELIQEENQILGKKETPAQSIPVPTVPELPVPEPPTSAIPTPVVNNPAPATPAQDSIFCRQCGAQNLSMYRFCSKCGSPLVK